MNTTVLACLVAYSGIALCAESFAASIFNDYYQHKPQGYLRYVFLPALLWPLAAIYFSFRLVRAYFRDKNDVQ